MAAICLGLNVLTLPKNEGFRAVTPQIYVHPPSSQTHGLLCVGPCLGNIDIYGLKYDWFYMRMIQLVYICFENFDYAYETLFCQDIVFIARLHLHFTLSNQH